MKKFLFIKNNLDRLAARMRKGDAKAAEALYEELNGKVFGFCMNRVGEKHVAEDLAQDIFLKLVSKIETFDSRKGSFTVWFWQLARNTVFDYYRRPKEFAFVDIGEDASVEVLAVSDPREHLEHRFASEQINKFIGTMEPEEQELFRLRYLAELSYAEIAEIMGKQEGALRVAVSRMKKKIKEHFREA